MTKIIGFGHRKRVGKDQSAKFLDTHLRCNAIKSSKLSFASKLKDVCYTLYGWAGLQPGIFYEDEANAHLREVILPDIGMTPREIWIKVGNKLREVYADTWIDAALRTKISADILIVTDVRFPNEVAKIQSLGGHVFKIKRPGVPVSDDASDSALDDFTGWNGIIDNDGDLKVLHGKIKDLGDKVINGTLWG